jgi:uncharacterized protein
MSAEHKPRRLDARSPFVFDTRELGRRPGAMREVERELPAAALLTGKASLDGLYSAEGSELDLDLRLESVVEGVLATGRLAGSLVGECVRCLDPIEVPLEADFQELFYYPGEQELPTDEGDEPLVVVEDLLNLEAVVRDSMLLDLPLQPLCEDDCPGLCPECGVHLADDPDHHHETVDPRWAALSRLQTTDLGEDSGDGPPTAS